MSHGGWYLDNQIYNNQFTSVSLHPNTIYRPSKKDIVVTNKKYFFTDHTKFIQKVGERDEEYNWIRLNSESSILDSPTRIAATDPAGHLQGHAEGDEDGMMNKDNDNLFCPYGYDEDGYAINSLLSSIIADDFNVSIVNEYTDLGSDPVGGLWNSLKTNLPVSTYTSKIFANIAETQKHLTASESATLKESALAQGMMSMVERLTSPGIMSAFRKYQNANLMTQGSRFVFYNGTNINFNTLSMKTTVFPYWRNGKFYTVNQQLEKLFPYLMGTVEPVDLSEIEIALKRWDENIGGISKWIKELASQFLMFQMPPAAYQPDPLNIDCTHKGTFKLKIGPYYALTGLVINDINLMYSRYMVKNPLIGESTSKEIDSAKIMQGKFEKFDSLYSPLYCEVSLQLKPTSLYTSNKMMEFASGAHRSFDIAYQNELIKKRLDEERKKVVDRYGLDVSTKKNRENNKEIIEAKKEAQKAAEKKHLSNEQVSTIMASLNPPIAEEGTQTKVAESYRALLGLSEDMSEEEIFGIVADSDPTVLARLKAGSMPDAETISRMSEEEKQTLRNNLGFETIKDYDGNIVGSAISSKVEDWNEKKANGLNVPAIVQTDNNSETIIDGKTFYTATHTYGFLPVNDDGTYDIDTIVEDYNIAAKNVDALSSNAYYDVLNSFVPDEKDLEGKTDDEIKGYINDKLESFNNNYLGSSRYELKAVEDEEGMPTGEYYFYNTATGERMSQDEAGKCLIEAASEDSNLETLVGTTEVNLYRENTSAMESFNGQRDYINAKEKAAKEKFATPGISDNQMNEAWETIFNGAEESSEGDLTDYAGIALDNLKANSDLKTDEAVYNACSERMSDYDRKLVTKELEIKNTILSTVQELKDAGDDIDEKMFIVDDDGTVCFRDDTLDLSSPELTATANLYSPLEYNDYTDTQRKKSSVSNLRDILVKQVEVERTMKDVPVLEGSDKMPDNIT